MAPSPLFTRFCKAPHVSDHAAAESRLADFLAEATPDLRRRVATPGVDSLLLGIADHSPYLWKLVRADSERLFSLLSSAPEQALSDCLANVRTTAGDVQSESELMGLLRYAKQKVALLIALADLGGAWDVENVMSALSDSADVFVSAALDFILQHAQAGGKVLADPGAPAQNCGVVVLALGKHGARELNYSSDTDLIILFDPANAAAAQSGEPQTFFVRLARRLVKVLQERTTDGYVLRVDLRLRPDPGSTAIAISLPAAYFYYESFGQNWERAAMIKARPIAGDRKLGETFLAQLTPFIWRRYFDFAAIADIHAMKRQIHAVRGHAEIAIAGHDLKLGRGGIREIEFFVQTQQLIYGGRRRHLRGSGTLAMLDALAKDELVSHAAFVDLCAAYLFLRETENRLQMIADEQTQRLPIDANDLERFSLFCGYPGLSPFASELGSHLGRVAAHYARLFEASPQLATEMGSLVFTGVTDDPETLETLTRLGFKDAALVTETIRGWHFGRRGAVSSERAREVLTELVPALLQAFAESGDPDAALAAFDQALGHMRAAVELLSLLMSNPFLRRVFADVLGSAPRLAEIVIRRPHVLDALIDRDRLAAPASDVDFDARLELVLAALDMHMPAAVQDGNFDSDRPHPALEDTLDALRDFTQEESFLIGLRLMTGIASAAAAGEAYSALAGAVVRTCLEHVIHDFASRFGVIRGGRCAVLAMGKLASREMTAASDLDLILIYDFDEKHPEAEAPQPLHATRYYTRLAQRLISALTVATRRGRLYAVDMRLRPSGRQGPLATQFTSFVDYQTTEAETWEHMALSRARVIAGDDTLGAAIESARATILQHASTPMLKGDIAAMRGLIAQEKGEADSLDLKYAAGGVLDVEFLAQYLCLRYAAETSAMIDVAPAALIAKAANFGYLTSEDADVLLRAHGLYTAVMQVLRTMLDNGRPLAQAGETLKRRLATAIGLPGFVQLQQDLVETGLRVRAIFQAIIG